MEWTSSPRSPLTKPSAAPNDRAEGRHLVVRPRAGKHADPTQSYSRVEAMPMHGYSHNCAIEHLKDKHRRDVRWSSAGVRAMSSATRCRVTAPKTGEQLDDDTQRQRRKDGARRVERGS